MANVQILRYEFLQNNTFGEFVAGDVLDVYLETDDISGSGGLFNTDGITVNLNGSPLTSTTLITHDPAIVFIQDFGVTTCVSTTYVVCSAYALFPYGTYQLYANHYSCVVNPPTCDLIVVGVPSVVSSTAENIADGSITITATSTNSIEYKIGSDFVYGDGTAQTSNTFSALLPSTYRIYMRDSANCAVNVLVVVPFGLTFGERFRFEYDDLKGNQTRIVVNKRSYVGASEEVCGDGTAFELSMTAEGSQNKFEPLISLRGMLGLLSETNMQFSELYTNDPNLYRVEYWKDFGSGFTLLWTGKILPQLYSEQYKAPPYSIQAISSDGLSELKDFYLIQDDGQRYFGTVSLIKLVAYCLSFLRLNLNIRVAVNMYADGMIVGSNFTLADGANDATVNEPWTIDSSPSVTVQTGVANQSQRILYEYEATGVTYTIQYGFNVTVVGSEQVRIRIAITDSSGTTDVDFVNLDVDATGPQSGTVDLTGTGQYISVKAFDLLGVDPKTVEITELRVVDVSMFRQAYVDYDCFYLAEQEPTLDFVLRSVLEPFGARLVQWENCWNIVRVEEMTRDYSYSEFNFNGVFIENATYSPVKELDFPTNGNDVKFVNAVQNLELRPGYGNITVKYALGLKPNIFNNGDFRLNSFYIPAFNTYNYSINKEGWNLVNAGYPLSEGYEQIGTGNVAYVISADDNIDVAGTAGEAYIQSQTYLLKMGTLNTVKILIRYKVDRASAEFAGTIYTIDVPYIKLRVMVRYGTQYLQSDGTWTDNENTLTFYGTEFSKYVETEIIAKQPVSGDPLGGMDFDIRVYHAYAYHAQFRDVDDLKAFVTYDSPDQVIPTGYRTELIDATVNPGINYYELEENTDSPLGHLIIRPDDYHALNNPRQWIFKTSKPVGGGVIGIQFYPMAIDKIQANFLVSGQDPFDTVVRNAKAEVGNRLLLEKDLIIGSYSELITTQANFGLGAVTFSITAGLIQGSPSISFVTSNILSAYLIYSGYLRDEAGVGYEDWARYGIAESDKVHGIFLKSYAAQYKRSWRLMRCDFMADNFFGFLNVFKEVNDSDRIYLPIGVTLNDKKCIYSGEFHELMDIYANPGSDGTGEAPYNSGFTTGFGASGYR